MDAVVLPLIPPTIPILFHVLAVALEDEEAVDLGLRPAEDRVSGLPCLPSIVEAEPDGRQWVDRG